jgi:O-antigen ligase
MSEAQIAGDARGITQGMPMRWYEWPLLAYFMIHFFPPVRGPWGSVCLALATIGVLWECRRNGCRPLADFNQPVVWCLALLGSLFAASLIQVPPELLGESWKRFSSDFLKGCGFGLVLFLYLRDEARARRVLMAGMFACALIVGHLLWDSLRDFRATGQLPFQRDHLFWSMFFFPFALVVYLSRLRLRWMALGSVAGIFAAAVMVGFRGAILALLLMMLSLAVFGGLWRLLGLGVGLAAAGLAALGFWFPGWGAYALRNLQRIDSSNRVTGHWIPAWDMTMEAPWQGHGYGHIVWQHHYRMQVDSHPAWTPVWSQELGWATTSPHSIFFETLFAAGWPGVMTYIFLMALVVAALLPIVWRSRHRLRTSPWLLLALAVLVAVIGNYAIFYQFESPNWRTLPIAIAIVAACHHALSGRARAT